MNDIFAENATIQLFGPLFIGAALALSLVVIGRLVANRKISRALSADDAIDPTDIPDPGLLAERHASVSGVPGWIDNMPTRKFVRKRSPECGSVDSAEASTIRLRKPGLVDC